MTPSADLSPPRRPIFFPVVIATVFLTIIGMVAGFTLGERDRGGSTSGSGTTGTSGTPFASRSVAMTGESCPVEMRTRAGDLGFPDDLRQVLKIQVARTGTTVWICHDYTGALYYQSKTKGFDSPLVQDVNALFLPGVTNLGGDHYSVEDGKGNTFDVTRTQFQVTLASGKVQTSVVTSAE